jgi:hypothetical protein
LYYQEYQQFSIRAALILLQKIQPSNLTPPTPLPHLQQIHPSHLARRVTNDHRLLVRMISSRTTDASAAFQLLKSPHPPDGSHNPIRDDLHAFPPQQRAQ